MTTATVSTVGDRLGRLTKTLTLLRAAARGFESGIEEDEPRVLDAIVGLADESLGELFWLSSLPTGDADPESAVRG